MLETLCKRINDEASRIANDAAGSQHDKYLRLFNHVMDQDDIVGNFFNDWRRSNIIMHLAWISLEQLLTPEDLSHLTEETQNRIEALREL